MANKPFGGAMSLCLNCGEITNSPQRGGCGCGLNDQEWLENSLVITSEQARFLGKQRGRMHRIQTLVSLREEAGHGRVPPVSDSGRPAQVILPGVYTGKRNRRATLAKKI